MKIIKKPLIAFCKYVIFIVLYSRLFLLKFRHKMRRGKFKPPSPRSIYRLTRIYLIKFIPELGRSTFAWSLADKTIRTRMLVLIMAFLAGFTLLSVRLFQIASSELVMRRTIAQERAGDRFDIVDRNGNALAVNVPSASLYANPRRVIEPNLAVKKLLKVFPELDMNKLLTDLKSGKSFIWIKRDITPKEQETIFNLGMPGFYFENEQKRIYTYGNSLAHVLGYVGRDMRGLAGIERYIDELQKDPIKYEELIVGNTLHLSIDIRLQEILSHEMDRSIEKFSAKGGAGIIVNPKSGEVLAMVSKPDFDPHFPGKATAAQRFNNATQGVYEVGSGMKSITMAIGFDTETITLNDAYDLSTIKVGNVTLTDDHPKEGWRSVLEIFMSSSNVGVVQICLEYGKANLRKYLKKFGMLDRLQIELPECGRPLFPPFNKWNDVRMMTMSYGYGISVSPAHFVQAMIPVANGGINYPITLLKQDPDKELLHERLLSESTSLSMRKMFRMVAKNGTGKKAQVPGYYVGGKTGTANKAVNGKYDMSKRISSFFGVLPATDPEYLVYFVLDEPKGIKETWGWAGGAWTAAPAVGRIFEQIVTLFGISKLDEHSPEVLELENVVYEVNSET